MPGKPLPYGRGSEMPCTAAKPSFGAATELRHRHGPRLPAKRREPRPASRSAAFQAAHAGFLPARRRSAVSPSWILPSARLSTERSVGLRPPKGMKVAQRPVAPPSRRPMPASCRHPCWSRQAGPSWILPSATTFDRTVHGPAARQTMKSPRRRRSAAFQAAMPASLPASLLERAGGPRVDTCVSPDLQRSGRMGRSSSDRRGVSARTFGGHRRSSRHS